MPVKDKNQKFSQFSGVPLDIPPDGKLYALCMGEVQDPLTIGQLAKRFGLNTKTLRYYEAVGILKAARKENGYRLYSEEDVEKLSFILRAKRVGFTLAEIGEVLRLGRHGRACGYVRDTLTRHIEAVDAQIADLVQVRAELENLHSGWREGMVPGGKVCNLIESVSLFSFGTTTKSVSR